MAAIAKVDFSIQTPKARRLNKNDKNKQILIASS